MNIYIAAPWVHKADALVAQEQFEAAGFTVVSHWIKYHADAETSAQELRVQALEDYLDIIARAKVFVILNLALSEGKAFEFGAAYHADIPCVVVGTRDRNIFYHLPGVAQVETVADAIAYCRTLPGANDGQ